MPGRTERAHFMMERAQFILDGHISYLKGFIPGLPERAHPKFDGAHTTLNGPIPGNWAHSRPEREALLKQSEQKTINFNFWEGQIPPWGPSRPYITPVTRALAAPVFTDHRNGICIMQFVLEFPLRSISVVAQTCVR